VYQGVIKELRGLHPPLKDTSHENTIKIIEKMRDTPLYKSQRHALEIAWEHALGGQVCVVGPLGGGNSTLTAVQRRILVQMVTAINIAVEHLAVKHSWAGKLLLLHTHMLCL